MSEYNIRIEIEKQTDTFVTTLIDVDTNKVFAEFETEDPEVFIDTDEMLVKIFEYVEGYDGEIRYVEEFEAAIMLLLDFKDEDGMVVTEIQFSPDRFTDIEFCDLTGHECAIVIDEYDNVTSDNFSGQTIIIEDREPVKIYDVYNYIVKNIFGYYYEPSDDKIRECFKMSDNDFEDLKDRRPAGKVWTDDYGIEYITVEGWC